jgi:GNAT superfamily N-acetyltransferase
VELGSEHRRAILRAAGLAPLKASHVQRLCAISSQEACKALSCLESEGLLQIVGEEGRRPTSAGWEAAREGFAAIPRPVDAGEAGEVAAIARDAGLPRLELTGQRPHFMEPDYLERAEAGVLHAVDEGGLAGFVSVLPRDDGAVVIESIVIEPDRQGTGLGRILVEFVEHLADHGPTGVVMAPVEEVDDGTRGFFRHLGYEETIRGDWFAPDSLMLVKATVGAPADVR